MMTDNVDETVSNSRLIACFHKTAHNGQHLLLEEHEPRKFLLISDDFQ